MKTLQTILEGIFDDDLKPTSFFSLLQTLSDLKRSSTLMPNLYWLPKDLKKMDVEINEFLDCCQPIKYKSNRWKRDWWYAYKDTEGCLSLVKVYRYFYISVDQADDVDCLRIDKNMITVESHKELHYFENSSKCEFYTVPDDLQKPLDDIFKKLVR